MGWGSAVYLFDAAVDVALDYAPKTPSTAFGRDYEVPRAMRMAVIHDMYTKVQWEDWDTQCDSKYYDELIHIMYELDEIDEQEYVLYTHHTDDLRR